MKAGSRTRAEATIAVESFSAELYDQSAGLMEVRLSETFTGDIEGESVAARAFVTRIGAANVQASN